MMMERRPPSPRGRGCCGAPSDEIHGRGEALPRLGPAPMP